MSRSVYAVILCLLLSTSLAQAGKKDEEEAVKDTLVAMWAAIERGDVEGYLK